MTRTAADVQAEIDALESADKACIKAAVDTSTGIDEALRLHLQTLEKTEPLKAELARALRAELDAATPPDVRDLALRLRDAYRFRGEYVVGAKETWEALETSEAKAWAAVAREAGR